MKLVRLGWPVSNAWLLPGQRVLVDSGIGAAWPQVLTGLRAHGLSPEDLTAVLLTHRHTDHAGNAARLQRRGAPIFAHRLDAALPGLL